MISHQAQLFKHGKCDDFLQYGRGSRSLAVNLTQTSFTGSVEATKPDLESISQEEDYDISQEVENITEQLLVGLKDKETIVRWSFAKGIGRVTGRLPKELADYVVESILECFRVSKKQIMPGMEPAWLL
ncbi:hypothetical protein cypCar_00029370 [Cyprinus carpio]|nr:hypothetical protein cypCar_00029370 [Cyprinus carpio]